MQEWLLDYLVCPKTGESLVLQVHENDGEEIVSGKLVNPFGDAYPIVGGVPLLGLDKSNELEEQTVAAFGKEWNHYHKFSGFMASEELFFQFLPVLSRQDFRSKVVLDAGCGNGRWLAQMAELGCERIIGLDYSDAAFVSYRNTKHYPNVGIVQGSISKPPLKKSSVDLIVSIGVIHHLLEPTIGLDCLRKVAKKENGKIAIWVYGYEGNELYFKFIKPFRSIGPRMNETSLRMLSTVLATPVWIHSYTLNKVCHLNGSLKKKMPMAEYFELLSNLNFTDIVSVVYDQLTPSLANYYKKDEILKVLSDANLDVTSIATPRNNSYAILAKST